MFLDAEVVKEASGTLGVTTANHPLKNRIYQVSIQCWAIIGSRAKRHLMAFRWRADDGLLIMVLGSSLPSSIKIRCQRWTLSDKTSWNGTAYGKAGSNHVQYLSFSRPHVK